VEKAAVEFMQRKLIREGYKVESREDVICGYDLYAVPGSKRRYIEVKGCAGINPRFFISRTGLKAARSQPSWALAIVTNARGSGAKIEYLFSGREMEPSFDWNPLNGKVCHVRMSNEDPLVTSTSWKLWVCPRAP
jgi:hypothetical protein